jgi:hypothetical protein
MRIAEGAATFELQGADLAYSPLSPIDGGRELEVLRHNVWWELPFRGSRIAHGYLAHLKPGGKMGKHHHGSQSSDKIASGISGFDEITRGGLPRGRVTVVLGGAGCGKTIFALQGLVAGARAHEPGLS